MKVPNPIPRSVRSNLLHRVYVPWVPIPEGRMVELPGQGGSTYVTDTPGPTPQAPTVILLHALGCTGLLTWFPVIPRLAERYRVVTLDQRWHGRGIQSDQFSLYDCADDVAALIDVLELEDVIVAGYSMGGVVAQRMWRQHRDKISGLVLCSTSDRFVGNPPERLFFAGMGLGMLATRGISHSSSALAAAKAVAAAADVEPSDIQEWALGEFRETSPWAVGQALAALGRHHSRPWLGKIDVPTAVCVTTHDHVIPPSRQVGLARAIKGATMHEVDGGHAACVLQSERFVPVFLEAVNTVNARRRDLKNRASVG